MDTPNTTATTATAAEDQTNPGLLRRRAVVGGLLGAAGIGALASLAKGGPLNPPAGPITPTHKPLGELEPRTALSEANTPGDASAVFVISQPGSYYLTADLVVPANRTAIRIDASDVTIDLNGFAIRGNSAAGTSGISATGQQRNIAVRNGSIESLDSHAVAIIAEGPCRLSDLRLRFNRGYGLLLSAPGIVERVAASNNAAGVASSPAGMYLGGGSVVTACSSDSNNGDGIAAGAYSVVSGCTARGNSAVGISVGPSGIVTGCRVWDNGGVGIRTQHSGVVEGCASASNNGAGITTSFASVVRNSAAVQNGGGGIAVWEGSLVARCKAEGNTGDGIFPSTGCLVSKCIASYNTNHGINAGSAPGSAIAGCHALTNSQYGVVASHRCFVRENTCENNSSAPGAGILITGGSNRVEGNWCGSGGYGIHVGAPANLIVRNTCAGNQVNWNIFSNNAYGPIVNRVAIGTSGMAGNGTVGSTLDTTDPHANFSY